MLFNNKKKTGHKSDYEWHTVYIILPRKLIDGRWALLHKVERISYWAKEIPASAPFDFFGRCYREKILTNIATQPELKDIDNWTHDDIRNFYDLYPNLTILTYAGMLGMTASEVKTILMSK